MTDADRIRERERENVANRLEKMVRHTPVLLAPFALVAVVDLVTGSVTGDSRIDVALLVAAALGLWGAYSTRQLARRLRSGNLPERATPTAWIRAAASMLVSLAVCAGVGYLLGGWTGAVLLSAVTIALIGVALGVGIRRRRRIAGRTMTR